jgi:hypothetical protein
MKRSREPRDPRAASYTDGSGSMSESEHVGDARLRELSFLAKLEREQQKDRS